LQIEGAPQRKHNPSKFHKKKTSREKKEHIEKKAMDG
jgi:hypothetical protein